MNDKPLKPVPVSERMFQEQVLQLAVMNGWRHFHPTPHHVRAGVWRSDGKGFPDLVLAHYKRGLIFAELKDISGKVGTEQMEWAISLNPWCEYYVWRPRDLQQIAERLGRAA